MEKSINNHKSFVLDLNRCTGCGACIVACGTQNFGKQDLAWRAIHTFNETHHPSLPLFNLSIACNHCEDPACVENCPANAYSKEKNTGAVIIDPDKCIGCKYCTWACPYDAPRYFRDKGVIQKCDFCIDRLNNNESPACTISCPVNALTLGDLEVEKKNITKTKRVPGFTDTKISPGIRFKELRKNRSPELTAPPDKLTLNRSFKASLNPTHKKINLKSEWTLLLFTISASVLVAFMAAFANKPEQINPFIFLASGILAMGLSTVHLGHKLRAYRAIFNFSRSWLSREILFFSLFLSSGLIYLLLFPQYKFLGIISAGIGFISLYSIDRIYNVTMKVSPINFHSAHAILNGIYLMGFISENLELTVVTAIIKISLYLHRKLYFWKIEKKTLPFISAFRIILGFFIPVFFLWSNVLDFNSFFWIILTIILSGEFIDRMEYYSELDIITPEKQVLIDLKNALS